ncbi:MAG: response regulator [Candidatus Omnitrophica bacterium]|nr:response regulator [Candidatus Omnitrophota bacterium]MDD5487831.1 response regulator [Candidatus Omnitrophota bacterium]
MDNEKWRILLVDDAEDLVLALKFQLESVKGYEVMTAYDGAQALLVLETFTPHLIVLDINMPNMGGIEFYNRICHGGPRPDHAVLVLTARANLEQIFRDINVDGFMPKPFDLHKLMGEIEFILEKRYGPVRAKGKKGVIKKVLIVEDNKEEFDKIALEFLHEGFTVDHAGGGLAAMEKIMDETPGILLINMGLKDISGVFVVSKLRQMPRTMDTPVILYARMNQELDYNITTKICEKIGINNVIEYDSPALLAREVRKLVGDDEVAGNK